MTKFFVVKDEYLALKGRQIENRLVCIYLGLFQLIVVCWALSQHIYSLVLYQQVLKCDFDNATGIETLIASVDVIIFDVGLFHSLWGIEGCVAEHLDGGYGRFFWCICHTFALVSFLPVALCVKRPTPMMLWPLLVQQSAYGVGLLILSLAALPRVLPAFMGDWNAIQFFPILVYSIGAGMNFLLLYVYWHWYWHVEAQYKARFPSRTPQPTRRPITHRPRAISTDHPPILATTTTTHGGHTVVRLQNGGPAVNADFYPAFIDTMPSTELTNMAVRKSVDVSPPPVPLHHHRRRPRSPSFGSENCSSQERQERASLTRHADYASPPEQPRGSRLDRRNENQQSRHRRHQWQQNERQQHSVGSSETEFGFRINETFIRPSHPVDRARGRSVIQDTIR
uniref:Uncharacterized protein n=1 Tax=Plectus sambesii TaxID=2011161 RepID=A0A914X6P8_9BILA